MYAVLSDSIKTLLTFVMCTFLHLDTVIVLELNDDASFPLLAVIDAICAPLVSSHLDNSNNWLLTVCPSGVNR